jgi:protein-tyrosine phosphatase
MAEGVLRSKLNASNVVNVMVGSAGISGENVGRRADPRARMAVRRHSGSIRELRARAFVDDDFENFDLILVMDEQNRLDVLDRAHSPEHAAKVRLLLDYTDGGEIGDPIHGTRADFERVFKQIERACDVLVEQLPRSRPDAGRAPVRSSP